MKYLTILFLFFAVNVFGQAGSNAVKAVPQRVSFVTIGAKDITKFKQFYVEKFGWTTLSENAGIAFFKMNGFILTVYPMNKVAADAQVSQDGAGFKRFSIGIDLKSEKEVDEVFRTLASKGVKILKAPVKAPWGGYTGYVADIEDNVWEIGYNPSVEMDAAGNVITKH